MYIINYFHWDMIMITTKTILMMMAEDNFYDDDDDDDDDDIFESRWRRHIGKECSRIWAAAKFTFNVPLLFVISIVISVIIWGSKLWKRGGSVADFVLQFRRKPTQPLPSLPKLLPSLSSSIIIIINHHHLFISSSEYRCMSQTFIKSCLYRILVPIFRLVFRYFDFNALVEPT